MNVNTIFPTRFVKADDLGDKQVTVAIKAATMENLGHGAEKETKLVIWFSNATKGLVLNKTNAFIIAHLYGPETDAWIGQSIILYAARIKAFGSWHNAVRVKEQIPARNVGAAKMPDAMIEEPPLDDENDLLDVDEGQETPIEPTRTIDTATGEITSPEPSVQATDEDGNPWNDDAPAPESAKGKTASQAQLNRIHALGMRLHKTKEAWDAERPRYVQWVTKGAVSSSKELQPGEADVLIAKMEKKLRTRAAAEMQSTGTREKVAA